MSEPDLQDLADGGKWWEVRERHLRAALRRIREKERLTIIQPFAPVNYDFPGMDVYHRNHDYLWSKDGGPVDIYFSQGYQHNIDALWHVTKSGQAGLTACWFWDNHHLFKSTTRAAMLADVSFCAHGFAADYIPNELGHFCGVVSLCPVFWSNSVARDLMAEQVGKPRRNELYGGYNSYEGLDDRDAFLLACKEAIPTNRIAIFRGGRGWDNHPYYSLSENDRFREWMSYKVGLCISFGMNTTIRMFDSLLSGQIPIVVGDVHDLESIIPLTVQEKLPLIRVRSLDPAAVREAYAVALERFDADGEEGVQRRSSYILENHMPRNRIIQMVDHIRNLDI